MNYKDGFMFGVFVVMMFAVGAYVGHSIGYVDGSLDERLVNKTKLESCQRLAVANMFEVENVD